MNRMEFWQLSRNVFSTSHGAVHIRLNIKSVLSTIKVKQTTDRFGVDSLQTPVLYISDLKVAKTHYSLFINLYKFKNYFIISKR